MDGPRDLQARGRPDDRGDAQALGAAGLALDDIDLFVYHQANARILARGGRAARAPTRPRHRLHRQRSATRRRQRSRWRSTRRAATAGCAAAPRVLLAAFGAGLTWGADVVEWGSGVRAEPAARGCALVTGRLARDRRRHARWRSPPTAGRSRSTTARDEAGADDGRRADRGGRRHARSRSQADVTDPERRRRALLERRRGARPGAGAGQQRRRARRRPLAAARATRSGSACSTQPDRDLPR